MSSTEIQDSGFKKSNSSTFINNIKLPIHRWYRFPAGFSAGWVKHTILKFKEESENKSLKVFDPFVGCGTTTLASEEASVSSIGIDAHPFLTKIAQYKLKWRTDCDSFYNFATKMLRYAKNLPIKEHSYPKLIKKCYSNENLDELDRLRRSYIYLNDNSAASELAWLALVCILRKTASVGTAQWQYVLPRKRKKNVRIPFQEFSVQVDMMLNDMKYFKSFFINSPQGLIYLDDARTCTKIGDNSIDLVITSPPYANNYDYADSTRLEMSFLGEINSWSELKHKVREKLIRSCSHQMSKKDNLDIILENRTLNPILDELKDACHKLEVERQNHAGRKNYHLMVAAYFLDLSNVWIALRRVCKSNAKICFVVGDSAPYGIYLPVDRWLGELAISAGFESYTFDKTRDRNIKWKIDRKHKIPLHEGRLWVKG